MTFLIPLHTAQRLNRFEERKMKMLGISASSKGPKSEILKLVWAVLKGAKSKGCAVELVDLCKLYIEYCTGALGELQSKNLMTKNRGGIRHEKHENFDLQFDGDNFHNTLF